MINKFIKAPIIFVPLLVLLIFSDRTVNSIVMTKEWSEPKEVYKYYNYIRSIDLGIDSKNDISFVFSMQSEKKRNSNSGRYVADQILFAENKNGYWIEPKRLAWDQPQYGFNYIPTYVINTQDRHIVWPTNNMEQEENTSSFDINYIQYNLNDWLEPTIIYEQPPDWEGNNFGFTNYKFVVAPNGNRAIFTNRTFYDSTVFISEYKDNKWNDRYDIFPFLDKEPSIGLEVHKGAIDYDSDSYLHIIYTRWIHGNDGNTTRQLFYSKQIGDKNWEIPIQLFDFASESVPAECNIVVDDNNVRHITWFGKPFNEIYTEGIYYSRSNDGINWIEPVKIDSARSFDFLNEYRFIVDNNSTAHFIWRKISPIPSDYYKLQLKYGQIKYIEDKQMEYSIVAEHNVPINFEFVESDIHKTSSYYFDIAVDSYDRVHVLWGEITNPADSNKLEYSIMHSYFGSPITVANIDEFLSVSTYPNPFNSNINIKLQPSNTMSITIDIYNINGKMINTITEDSELHGTQYYTWDGKDNFGHQVSTGIYFISIDGKVRGGGKKNITKKVTLLF